MQDLSEGIYVTYRWYDPNTDKMGEADPEYPGARHKTRFD